jgi:hypothetical protein
MSDTGRTDGDNSHGPGGGSRRLIVGALVLILAAAAAVTYVVTRRPAGGEAATRPTTTTAPATQPQTAPTTRLTRSKASPKARGPATQYFDVIQANYPRMPDAKPMPVPLDVSQAARFVFPEPVYLSPRGDLWITRADAPPTDQVLARAAKEQADQLLLTVREPVAFVHWIPRETGPWAFGLVVQKAGGAGYEWVTQGSRVPVGTPGRNYKWDRAQDWNERVVVASDTGVSVFEWEPQVREMYYELAPKGEGAGGASDRKGKLSEPQFLLDWQGVLAWLPWERGKAGGRGAARFVEGQWTALGPEQGWPQKLMHLVPLFDGNVLQLVAGEGEAVTIAMASLEQVKIDEAQVAKLVEQLSAEEEQTRKNAYQELTRFGPSLGPILERLMKDEAPEAQARLKQLLKTQLEPTLGGMTLLGDQLRLVSRLSDGGAVFYAEAGVMTPGPGDSDTPVFHTPAWLAIRPGQPVTLLEPPLTTDMNPDRSRIYAFRNDWVVTNDARGPQRFVGNGFDPLLRKSELAAGYTEPVGVDTRGRWLFRKPAEGELAPAGPAAPEAAPEAAPGTRPTTAQSKPATAATTTVAATTTAATTGPADSPSATLVLDPTLPDPTPRLPVWPYTTAEMVGWQKDNWPVVKRGGGWVLGESGWRALNTKMKEQMFTKAEEAPAVPIEAPAAISAARAPIAPAATAPTALATAAPVTAPTGPDATRPAAVSQPALATTAPTTGPGNAVLAAALTPGTPTTSPTADDLGPPLLIDRDGNRYYDGKTMLRIVAADGSRTDWPLPPEATGDGIGGKVFLVRAADGLLFLFNRSGRVVRIRPMPDGDAPYAVDATFTRNVPSADTVTRVWLDPAGRIIMAYGSKMAIMFPRGFIPPAISKLIPPGMGDVVEP